MDPIDKLLKKYTKKLPEKILQDLKLHIPVEASEKQLKEVFEAVYQEYLAAVVDAGGGYYGRCCLDGRGIVPGDHARRSG